jgi:hypothetical protein
MKQRTLPKKSGYNYPSILDLSNCWKLSGSYSHPIEWRTVLPGRNTIVTS